KYVGGKLLYDNQRRPDESAIPARKQGDVLHTFVDEDSNMESRVVVGDRGFNVVLLDLDSGQFVPQARIYPFDLENAEQRAVDAAKTVLRPIAKAHVKQYTRASRSGAPVTVKEHDDKRPNARLKLKGFRRPGQQQPPAHRLATLHSAGPDSPGRTFRIQPGDKPGAWNIHPDDQRTVAGGLKEQAAPPKPVGPAPSGSAEAVIARPSTAYKPVNDAGRDTEERFKNSDGSWTVERQQLHNAILAKLAEPAAPPSQTPVFFMTGGGPAAGKGNILKSGSLQLPQNHMSIDADEIKKLLPEYRELVAKKDVKASVFAHEESSYLSTAAISHAAKNKFHAVYDSVGDSGLEKLAGKIKLMRAGGHKVVAHYVTCSTDAAISRARARGEKTGRFVPDAVIRGGHAAVSRILPELMKSGLLDECSLWDTEAGKPRLVASSKAKKVTVHDKTLWKQFLDKSNDDEQRQPAAA
ncbi:MAG TPA: zeta toxin family protein, partial [Candidatus Acidoferrales bacterium]|nr:zeta toxin family protein [Candidatus Acidoferrales bacterium]